MRFKLRKTYAPLMLACLLMSGCSGSTGQPAPTPSPLHDLVGANGLYVSAETLAAIRATVSVSDTVYDDLTIHLAGRSAPAMWKAPAGVKALSDFAQKHPVWGQWFIYMAEKASGGSSSQLHADSVESAFHPAGYFADPGDTPADTASELAQTQAALEVLVGTGTRPSAPHAEAIARWLSARAARLTDPIQACQLTEAFTSLGQPTPPAVAAYADNWLDTHISAGLKETNSLADFNAAACAGHSSPSVKQRLTSMLAPYLSGSETTTALQRFQLAQAWLALGNDSRAIVHLSAVSSSDLDDRGASQGKTVITGNLVPTYLALDIEQRLGHRPDSTETNAIAQALQKTSPTADPIEYLAGAAALCEAQACPTDRSGIDRATSVLPREISEQNAAWYPIAAQALTTLHINYPATTLGRFDKTTDEDFYYLLQLAAAGNQAAGQQLTSVDVAARWRAHSKSWDLDEVSAAVLVLGSRHALSPDIAASARDRYAKSRGCDGIAALYATDVNDKESTCDLSTTLNALQASAVTG